MTRFGMHEDWYGSGEKDSNMVQLDVQFSVLSSGVLGSVVPNVAGTDFPNFIL